LRRPTRLTGKFYIEQAALAEIQYSK